MQTDKVIPEHSIEPQSGFGDMTEDSVRWEVLRRKIKSSTACYCGVHVWETSIWEWDDRRVVEGRWSGQLMIQLICDAVVR